MGDVHQVVAVEVNRLILNAAPKSFNEDVVSVAATAVSANGNVKGF